MNHDSEMPLALVTGATGGIGLETARQLASLGMRVIIGGRKVERIDAAVSALREQGLSSIVGFQLDVTSESDRHRVRDYVTQQHDRLDILINNAGVWLESADAAHPPQPSASTLHDETLRATFETNFFAPVALTQVLLPLIRKAPQGRIVNVSSIRGSLTLNADPGSQVYFGKAFAYDTSKTALNMFTLQLACELRDTLVKVNALHPGWIRTGMGGQQADLDVQEGSRTSVRLATLPANGPTGKFFYMEDELPW